MKKNKGNKEENFFCTRFSLHKAVDMYVSHACIETSSFTDDFSESIAFILLSTPTTPTE